MERETHHVAVVAVAVIAVAVIVVAVVVAVVVVVSTSITLQCNRVFHLINWGNVLESK